MRCWRTAARRISARSAPACAIPAPDPKLRPLAEDLLAIALRESDEIAARFPKVQRRVGGYNLDALAPNAPVHNLAHILVGSEGTLGFSTKIELKLWPLLGRRAVGACHFARFYDAMAAAQHIVKLKPIAVELVDRTMIELARGIEMFRPTVDAFVRGAPDAVLLVEFAEEDWDENISRLRQLEALMGDLGFAWGNSGAKWGGVAEVLDPKLQAAITEVRTAGLNIMMSMKEEGKPVSFVEDCAVPLEHLAEYTSRLTAVFEKHGTRGTWYAHASVGCLHVRPVLNLRLDKDKQAMREIAEEAFAIVAEYKGSHSGEHGDGLVRSEFHAPMFGERLVHAFEEVKDRFDPGGLFNPGKIVRAPEIRRPHQFPLRPGLSRRADDGGARLVGLSGRRRRIPGRRRDVQQQRRLPRARRRRHVPVLPRDPRREGRDPRPRQFAAARRHRTARPRRARLRRDGGDHEAVRLLQGVPARMPDRRRHGAHEDRGAGGTRGNPRPDAAQPPGRLAAALRPGRGTAPLAVQPARSRFRARRRCRKASPIFPRAAPCRAGAATGSGTRKLPPPLAGEGRGGGPCWRGGGRRGPPRLCVVEAAPSPSPASGGGKKETREVVLLADTFNRYFEPENLHAADDGPARRRLSRPCRDAGRRTSRPLCCGRTFLAVGRVDEARREAERALAALAPYAARGVPIIGLEPSCLFSFRDEIPAIVRDGRAAQVAGQAVLFEEFLAREARAGRLALPLAPLAGRALLHGHCHQKSFDAMGAVETVLKLVPELAVETIDSSCCGMAGSFGYHAETIDVSLAMGELSLLPAVRNAPADAIIVADGTSCRHQIKDGTGRAAIHVARVLASEPSLQRGNIAHLVAIRLVIQQFGLRRGPKPAKWRAS